MFTKTLCLKEEICIINCFFKNPDNFFFKEKEKVLLQMYKRLKSSCLRIVD